MYSGVPRMVASMVRTWAPGVPSSTAARAMPKSVMETRGASVAYD